MALSMEDLESKVEIIINKRISLIQDDTLPDEEKEKKLKLLDRENDELSQSIDLYFKLLKNANQFLDVNIEDYVTPLLEQYAKLTDIPQFDLSPFATRAELVNYLVHSDLDNYVLNSDLPDFSKYAKLSDISQIDLSLYAKLTKLQEYYKKSEFNINDYALKSTLIEYAKKTDIPQINLSSYATIDLLGDYCLKSDLSEYAKKTELGQTDLTNYALISQLSEYVKATDLGQYAKKTDIPQIDLTQYAKKTDIPQIDLTTYAKKTDIPQIDLSEYVKAEDLPDLPDLTEYVKFTDLPQNALDYTKLVDSVLYYNTIQELEAILSIKSGGAYVRSIISDNLSQSNASSYDVRCSVYFGREHSDKRDFHISSYWGEHIRLKGTSYIFEQLNFDKNLNDIDDGRTSVFEIDFSSPTIYFKGCNIKSSAYHFFHCKSLSNATFIFDSCTFEKGTGDNQRFITKYVTKFNLKLNNCTFNDTLSVSDFFGVENTDYSLID